MTLLKNILQEFQTKRAEILKNPSYIPSILEKGRKIAKQNAVKTLKETVAG